MDDFQMTRDNEKLLIHLPDKLTVKESVLLQPLIKKEIENQAREIVFDMKTTQIIDSMGIGLLISTMNTVNPLQGSIRLIHVSLDITKLLQNMRLFHRLNASSVNEEVSHG